MLDKALVTYFKAPHSYTGEDVVEFALHASPYIKGRLLELLCANGATLAKRGEFSQRAFLNGKMSLTQAPMPVTNPYQRPLFSVLWMQRTPTGPIGAEAMMPMRTPMNIRSRISIWIGNAIMFAKFLIFCQRYKFCH